MRKKIIELIIRLVDSVYIKPLRFIPLNTFRYAAVGGANMAFNIVVYWFSFHFILNKQNTDFGIFVMSPHILSIFIAFIITVIPGFWLTRNVAFAGGELKSKVQLMRYAQVVVTNILINYFGLKLLVEICGFYPTPSYIAIQVLAVAFSYLMQRFYTFKGHDKL